ncbi:toll-like receptor 13 [Octopus vulgaris]|uniref:Toll-like receptor 13 n=1 Tax=Octopus vulgaris TaxID=6645 RepID=A0AA36APX6_OCTVU|nr:toll-like receptor 13 [Octopus vulgaris]
MILNVLLKPLTKLHNLEIFEGGVSKIPEGICNITSLRTLTIGHTSIDEWKSEKCPAMTSLTMVRLAYNKVFNVNKTLFSPLLFSNKKLKFDLSHNPFVCDCNILWFRDWMKRNPRRILDHRRYLCNGPGALRHTHLEKYSVSWEYCENRGDPSTIAVTGVAVAVLSIIFVILAILSYTKRWSIRLCIYQSLIRKRKYKALVNDGRYKYDAFVCYCSADANWVLNKLLPIIEEENHFNLCLHDRDFLVGNDIVDNIVDSMQQSRKVVLVLSNDFAQSSWCQFEASIAQQKILEEHYDIIIPVLLNEIPSNLQTKRLGVLLKQKTYLEWPNETEYEEMFWERFIRRLCKSEIDNEI